MRFESFYFNFAFTRENYPIVYAKREKSDSLTALQADQSLSCLYE